MPQELAFWGKAINTKRVFNKGECPSRTTALGRYFGLKTRFFNIKRNFYEKATVNGTKRFGHLSYLC